MSCTVQVLLEICKYIVQKNLDLLKSKGMILVFFLFAAINVRNIAHDDLIRFQICNLDFDMPQISDDPLDDNSWI